MNLPDLANKLVLIVEDDEMSYLYLHQLMMLTNAEIYREVSGRGALELFRSGKKFEMVFMDIQLPDMDGKWVTRKIREMDRDVPIIAQTASRSAVEWEQILEAGCTDMINKPYTMEMLFGVIEKHIHH